MEKYIAYLIRRYVAGNGEIIKYHISSSKVESALERAGFGEAEKQLIVRTLELMGITEAAYET